TPMETYSVEAGISASSASTTGFRPATASPVGADFFCRVAGGRYPLCQVRSEAFGVGPRPASFRRPWPPEPLVGPFFFEDPLRRELICSSFLIGKVLGLVCY